MADCVHYRGGYKYQLQRPLVVQTHLRPEKRHVIGTFVRLEPSGELGIGAHYAWDGPSGPTIDTKNFMRGALVHDALYQLMRETDLDRARWRKVADDELARICREDGMTRLRAWWVHRAVRWFADPASDPANKKPEHAAPRGCTEVPKPT